LHYLNFFVVKIYNVIISAFILSSNPKENKPKRSNVPKSTELKSRALQMFRDNYKQTIIARDLGIHINTVHKWIKQAGLNAIPVTAMIPKDAEGMEFIDPLADILNSNLNERTAEAVKLAKHNAATLEEKEILDLAEAQSTPADKYQHYIAAASIKLLRDSIKHLRGPKTVRELSELDQLIRRNLGLNSKSAGGTSKMHIDISILNNSAADRGNGAVKRNTKIIDIEPESEE
jgi:hypothetical protein